jgi:hypothetical protein
MLVFSWLFLLAGAIRMAGRYRPRGKDLPAAGALLDSDLPGREIRILLDLDDLLVEPDPAKKFSYLFSHELSCSALLYRPYRLFAGRIAKAINIFGLGPPELTTAETSDPAIIAGLILITVEG